MSPRVCHASCLCGAVRWEVDGPFDPPPPTGRDDTPAMLVMSHCHCSRCRKAHGAPYATYLAVPEGAFRLTQGREHIVRWRSSEALLRPFCDTCGSVVPDGAPWSGMVGMPAGNFDEDLGLTPRCHIFVASKAPWVEILDDLPRFDAYPGDLMPPMETRAPLDPDTGQARGSCLCGAVSFVVQGPLTAQAEADPARPFAGLIGCRTCHCSRCRKAASAAHRSNLVVPLDAVRFTRGEDARASYKVPDARYFTAVFCRTCGSSSPRTDPERGIAVIPMGALDDDPGVRPAKHIWVGSRAPWDVILDGAPQFQEI